MICEHFESVQLPLGVTISSERFKLNRPGKPELCVEIEFLNGMLYIWVGLTSMHQLTNLQIAYPGNNKYPAVCSQIVGEDSLESSNQIMTKHLSQKFGLPIMLSFNYHVNEFEENTERIEIFKWISSIIESKIKK